MDAIAAFKNPAIGRVFGKLVARGYNRGSGGGRSGGKSRPVSLKLPILPLPPDERRLRLATDERRPSTTDDQHKHN